MIRRPGADTRDVHAFNLGPVWIVYDMIQRAIECVLCILDYVMLLSFTCQLGVLMIDIDIDCSAWGCGSA